MLRDVRARLRRNGSKIPLRQVISEFGRANPRATFVQLGSNDGTHLDPLHEEIAARKWTGVMIEPVPYLFDRLRLSYSGVEGIRFVNAAIADHDGTQRLYYLPEDPDDSTLPPWYDTLASFRKDVILRHQKEIPDIGERLATLEVPCVTFETLCRDHEIDSIDLIHTICLNPRSLDRRERRLRRLWQQLRADPPAFGFR